MALAASAGLFLSACGRGLPEDDPPALLAEVERRIEAAPYPAKGAQWLIFVAGDGREETRDLLVEHLNEFGALSHISATLLRQYWREDPRARAALAAYYMDATRSRYDRQIAYLVAIRTYKDRYPEFQGLPPHPPVPASVPRVVE